MDKVGAAGSDPFLSGVTVKQTIIIKPEDAGKPVTIDLGGGTTLKLPTILSGPPIERPAPWTGERPTSDFPASVHGVLKKLNQRTASGGYAVSDPELLAAKKNLMQYWGLSSCLKADGSNLRLKAVFDTNGKETEAGVTPNGFFYGILITAAGREVPFELNVYAEPKFSAADVERLRGYFKTDG